MIRSLTAVTTGLLITVGASAEPIELETGKWTAAISISAMGQSMTDSMTECLGMNEANMQPEELAKAFAGGADCVPSNVQQSGSNVSFQMSCPGQAMVSGNFSLVHQPSTFTITADVLLDIGENQVIPGQMVVQADRVGACDLG